MRKFATTTFMVLMVSHLPGGWAQAQDAFPWRSNHQGSSQVQTVVPPSNVSSSHVLESAHPNSILNQGSRAGLSNQVPTPPRSLAPSIFASLRTNARDAQDEAAPAQQPSLSDVNESQFNEVPAPGPTTIIEPVASDSAPLAVNSNATPAVADANYCQRDCNRGCELGCIKRIFGTAPNGLEVGGWAQFGYHNRDTILFNDRRGNFAPHQIWMYAGKEAQRCDAWGLGYRIDALYGIDAQNTQAFGNEPTGTPDGWDNDWDNGAFGWALPQTYLQLANRNWDVKIGKFFSGFGIENIASPENFFYSRTYTNVNSTPFTLTGLVAERQVSARRSVIIGGSLGWDTGFEQNQSGANLITGTRFSPNQFVDLSLMSSIGNTGYRGDGSMNTITANVRLTDRVSYAMQGTYLDLDDNQDLGFINSLFREINCCLSVGARIEWWKSDQFSANNRSTYAFTMGANYRRNANLMFRPEVRWDWGGEAIDNGEPIVGFDFITLF